jgi:hypothetical protein
VYGIFLIKEIEVREDFVPKPAKHRTNLKIRQSGGAVMWKPDHSAQNLRIIIDFRYTEAHNL